MRDEKDELLRQEQQVKRNLIISEEKENSTAQHVKQLQNKLKNLTDQCTEVEMGQILCKDCCDAITDSGRDIDRELMTSEVSSVTGIEFNLNC